MLAGGARVELKPAPMLRCTFAESVAGWLRDEAAPRVEKIGSALKTVETDDDFECRGRNRVAGAKVSEHGKGNAVDLRSFVLADGRAPRAHGCRGRERVTRGVARHRLSSVHHSARAWFRQLQANRIFISI
jgi:hypothetical protein